jgi:hypothetical protein
MQEVQQFADKAAQISANQQCTRKAYGQKKSQPVQQAGFF